MPWTFSIQTIDFWVDPFLGRSEIRIIVQIMLAPVFAYAFYRFLFRIKKNDMRDDSLRLEGAVKLRSKAKTKGTVVSYSGFKNGVFRPPSKLESAFMWTTMLTDRFDIINNAIKAAGQSGRWTVISANSPTKTSFLLEFQSGELTVQFRRQMMNIFEIEKDRLAAEDPKNYEIEIAIKGEKKLIEAMIIHLTTDKVFLPS